MSVVGIPEGEQDAVFRTVAAVLHLGNIEFVESPEGGADASAVAPAAEEHLAAAAALLGVDAEGLRKALTTRTRQTPDGAIVSPIDVAAAEDNRDSLSKTIYSRTFDWLVEKINTSIGQDPAAANLIGVLDIYGGGARQGRAGQKGVQGRGAYNRRCVVGLQWARAGVRVGICRTGASICLWCRTGEGMTASSWHRSTGVVSTVADFRSGESVISPFIDAAAAATCCACRASHASPCSPVSKPVSDHPHGHGVFPVFALAAAICLCCRL